MFTKIAEMLSPSIRRKEGFTLIELLIVVAIIAILAAIAIPQFSAYRQRGFNSAGNSDIRNMKIATEAFMTDWRGYASTVGSCSGAGGGNGVGVVCSGPMNVAVTVAVGAIFSNIPSAATTFTFGVSNGVIAVVHTSTNGANYTAGAGHTQGDKIFKADSKLTQLKYVTKAVGTAMIAGNIESSTNATTADVTGTDL